MLKGREGDRDLWHPSGFQTPVMRSGWKKAEAKSLYRASEGRGGRYQERKRKLAETAVVITTSGVIFINLQDQALPLSSDQTEKGKVKLCQKRPEREEEEGEGEDRTFAQENL